jgi:hypothetical protein
MSQFIVRLYGRFVYLVPLERGSKGRGIGTCAIAVDPKADPSLPNRILRHRVLMTIPRAALGEATHRPPLFDITAGADIHRAEHCVWDLHGCEVTIGSGRGAFRLIEGGSKQKPIVLPNMSLLHQAADFDMRCLKVGAKGGLISTVVKFQGNTGTTNQVESGESNFAPFADPTNTSPVLKGALLADMIEIPFDDAPHIAIKRRRDREPATLPIVEDRKDSEPVIISLSNICSASVQDIDEEFAAFYRVLKKFPKRDERLVPVVGARFDEDCYKSALMRF